MLELALLLPMYVTPVDDACDWVTGFECAEPVQVVADGGALSIPGLVTYVEGASTLAADENGILNIDTRTYLTGDPLPSAGYRIYQAVCVDSLGNIQRLDSGRTVQEWWPGHDSHMYPATSGGLQTAGITVGTDGPCGIGERRALFSVAGWASDAAMYEPGYEPGQPGWEDGDNVYNTPEGGAVRVTVSSMPEYGQAGTVVLTVGLLAPNIVGMDASDAADALEAAGFTNYSGPENFRFNYGTPAYDSTYWSFRFGNTDIYGCSDNDCDGGGILTRSVPASHYGMGTNQSEHDVIYYRPVGYPDRPEITGGESDLTVQASITYVGAIEDIKYIPESGDSNVRDIPGACPTWADCSSMCGGYGADIAGWFACVFGVGHLDVGDTMQAIMSDQADAPAVAGAYVIVTNVERSLTAIAAAGETCGVLADFTTPFGDFGIDTCTTPDDLRSFGRGVAYALISLFGSLLVVNQVLWVLGLPTVFHTIGEHADRMARRKDDS